jgi:hypothetical protein
MHASNRWWRLIATGDQSQVATDRFWDGYIIDNQNVLWMTTAQASFTDYNTDCLCKKWEYKTNFIFWIFRNVIFKLGNVDKL